MTFKKYPLIGIVVDFYMKTSKFAPTPIKKISMSAHAFRQLRYEAADMSYTDPSNIFVGLVDHAHRKITICGVTVEEEE